jgi:ribosomal protein S18 acetylase RimI-like enzyme
MLIRALWKRGIDAVVLDTTPENRRARHVYESLGFKQVRINENSWTDQLGNLRSSVDYRLTPETFRDLW